MAKLTNIVTRSALLLSVLLISAFTLVNCAWADVVVGETTITVTNDTYTYDSSSSNLPVILYDSTLFFNGSNPSTVEVHGECLMDDVSSGFPLGFMNVSGDGSVTYSGGWHMRINSVSNTGTTTIKIPF